MNTEDILDGSEITFTEYMSNKKFYDDRLSKKMDFTLKKLKALKRIRELESFAKDRKNSFAREKAWTLTRMTDSEKDEYLELIATYFSEDKYKDRFNLSKKIL